MKGIYSYKECAASKGMRSIRGLRRALMIVIATVTLAGLSLDTFGQFDDILYMPPIWQTGSNPQNNPSELVISTPFNNVTVNVRTADNSWSFNGTVSSNSPLVIQLTPALGQTVVPNAVIMNGLIVTASAPVQAAHRVVSNTSQSVLTMKGASSAGTLFYCGSPTRNGTTNTTNNSRHFISVMALEDNTQITFQTPFVMQDIPNPHTVTLQKGQSYCIRSQAVDQHVTGARVTSTKKIITNSGSIFTPVPGGGNNGSDAALDQLLPVEFAGLEYAVVRGSNPDPLDYVIVVGTEDNTEVFLDGSLTPLGTVNTGQFIDISMTGTAGTPHYIRASDNIFLFHISGNAADDEVDMAIIPAITCTGSRYLGLSKFPGSIAQRLQLIISDGAQANLTINGTPYTSFAGVITNPIPGLTGWRSASIPGSSLPNNMAIQANDLFHAAWLVGSEVSAGYGFFSRFNTGFDFIDPVTGLPTPVYSLGTLCQGQSIDHCVNVLSCGVDNEIIGYDDAEGVVVISPPSSPGETCFRYTAGFNEVGLDTVYFTFGNELGYTDVLEVVFLIINQNTPINAGPDQQLCTGASSTTLSAINPDPMAQGYWTVVQGTGVLANPNSPTTTVSNLSLGQNVFAWNQYYAACDQLNSDLVVVSRFSGTPPAANAGPDASLCSSSNYTMQANSPGGTATGTWEILTGNATIFNINSPTALVTNIGIGVNTFRWTISNAPCPGTTTTDDMIIYVYDQNHPPANAGPDQSVCQGSFASVSLLGNTPIIPATGQWTVISGTGTFANPTSPSTTVSGLSFGDNVYRWTIFNGPCGTLTDDVVIKVFNPASPAANAGPDQSLCLPVNSTSLAGNSPVFPATGAWSVIAGTGSFSNINDPAATVSGLSLGTNTFRWTLNNGPCSNGITIDDVTVLVYPAVQPPANAGADQELCFTGSPLSALLGGNAPVFPGTGMWSVVFGTGVFSNPTSPSTSVSGMGVGTNVYQWTLSNGPCGQPESDLVTVTVFSGSVPAPSAGPDASLCTPQTSYTMQASAVPFPSSGQWSLVSGTGVITNAASPTTQVTNLGIGENIFRWTVFNGPCGAGNFDEVIITVFNSTLPSANAGSDQQLCFSELFPVSTTMSATPAPYPAIGSWSLVSGGGTILDPTDPATSITGLPVGTNVFEWSVNNGACGSSTDLVSLVVYSPSQTAADAGQDQQVCSTQPSASLQANALVVPATGLWTVVNGSGVFADPSSPSTTVSGLSLGTNTFRWTIFNGPCSTPSVLTDLVVITVFNSAQAPANAGPDQTICSTIPLVNLAANTAFFPAVGTWTITAGTGIISNQNSPNAIVTGLSVGTNTFRWTIDNGPCGAPTFDEITITVFDQNAPAADAGQDQFICLPLTQVNLVGNNAPFPATGTWSLIAGTGVFTDANDPLTVVSGLSIGSNTFQWTIQNGACNTVTSDQMTVFVFDSDQALPDAGPDAFLCTPQSTYVMQANPVSFPAVGSWSLLQGTGTIGNMNNPTTTISGLGVGANTFRWTISNGPCPDGFNTDDITIFVFDQNQPPANAGADQQLCFDGVQPVSTGLLGSPLIYPASGMWTLVSGSGFISNPQSPNPTVTNLGVGENVFRWTVDNGSCVPATTFDEVSVFVFPFDQPVADAGADQELCSTSPVTQLQGNAPQFPGSGQWSIVQGGGSFANASNPTTAVSGLAIGTNILRWTISNGACIPSITFDDVVIVLYNAAQTNANAGPDQNICSTVPFVSLAANPILLPANGMWSVVSGTGTFGNMSSANSIVSGLSIGVNTFRWIIDNGPCSAPTVDEMTVTVFDQNAPAASAGQDQFICLPQTQVNLQSNTPVFPATGFWSVVTGSGVFADATNPLTVVSGLAVGSNTLRWTIQNGACNSVTSDDLTVFVFDVDQELPDAGPDAFLCTPQSTYIMQANPVTFPALGTWTLLLGTGTIANPNSPTTTISGLGIGQNTFRWTISNGPCPDGLNSDEMSIFVFDQNQPVANAGPNQQLCFDGVQPPSTVLFGSSLVFPASGTWTLVTGSGFISDPSSPSPTVSNLAVGHNIFRWTVSNGPCQPETTFDEVSVFVFPFDQPAADAGPDQELCSTIPSTQLAGNFPVFPGTGQWTVVQGTGVFADAGNPITIVSGLATGTNILRWTVFNGACIPSLTFDDIVITVFNAAQAAANAGLDQSICSSVPFVTLTGNLALAPATSQWSLVSGTGLIISPTLNSSIVLDLSVGLNVFEYTIFNGPCAAPTIDQVTVVVFDQNQAPANAGLDQSICLPQTSVTLSGNALTFPATGQWTLVSGVGLIDDPASASVGVSGLSIGENVFRWTISNGTCLPGSSFDQVSIFVFDDQQPVANAGPDQSFCEPINSTLLAGNAPTFPAIGVWTLVSGSGVISDPLNPLSQVTGLAVGENIFRWTITNGVCPGSQTDDEVSIFIFDNDQPPANAGTDQVFCSPAPIAIMAANAPTFPATGQWELVSGSGVIGNFSDPNSTISGLAIGENVFRWSINNGPCLESLTTDVVSIFVFDSDADPADAGPDQSICAPLSEVVMAANTPVFPAGGLWELLSGSGFIQNPTSPTSQITNLAVGENVFRWTVDNGGCGEGTTIDLVSIFVFSDFSPDAFTGQDQDLCTPQTSTMLTGNFPVFPAYGEWTLISGVAVISDLNDPNAIVSDLGIGLNVFEWTIFNGPCANGITSDQVVVSVFDGSADAPFAGNDQELCSPQFSTLLAADPAVFPGTGTWTVIGGTGTFSDPNDPSAFVDDLSIGFNVLRWTVDYSVCGSPFDEVNIIVYDSDQPAADAGLDQQICNTDPSTTLQANVALAPGYGTWTVIQGTGTFDNPNQPNTLVSNMSVGENLFVWEIYTAGCLAPELSRDTVAVFVFDDTDEPAFAGDDQFFCTPLSASTLVGGPITFPSVPTWTLIQGTGVVDSPNSITTAVSGLTVGENIFELSLFNGPCSNITSDQVSIFIFDEDQPAADAGPDQFWCTPVATTQMEGNGVIFPATGVWLLLSGSGVITDPTDPNSEVSGLSVGENVFQWRIDNGPCSEPTFDVVSVFIFDENQPDAYAGTDQEFCFPDDEVVLQGNGLTFPATGVWSLIQGAGIIDSPFTPQTQVTGLGIGENLFVWKILNGPCANFTTADTMAVRIYDPNAAQANAGPDQQFCSPTSTATMNAQVPEAPGFGTWSVVSGFALIDDINDPATAISGLTVGETILQWMVYNGPCAITNTIDLVSIFIFDENQPQANAGADQNLCTPQFSTQLSGNSFIFPGTGQWTLESGSGTIVDPSDPNTTVDNLGIGPNVFRWTIFNGPCDPTQSFDDVVINLFDNSQQPANAGPDQEICLPETTVNVVGSPIVGSSTGLWSSVSEQVVYDVAIQSSTVASNLNVGVNELIWTVFNGPCSITADTLTVLVFDPGAAVADAGLDSFYCTPVSAHAFSANTPDVPGTGTWSVILGNGSIDNPNDPQATVSGLTIGEHIFEWSIYNGPCAPSTTDLISVFIYDENQEPASAGPDQEICEPAASVIMQANTPVFPAVGVWTILQGQGTIADLNDPNTLITDLAIGVNIFEWTLDNGPCDNPVSSDQVAIIRYPDNPDVPNAGSDQQVCTPIISVTMTGAVPSIPGVGTWTLVSGTGVIADVNDPGSMVTGLSVGENIFRWTVYNGPCTITNQSDLVSIFLFDNTQSVADAGADLAFCTPIVSTQLAGNQPIFPAYGEWTVVSGSVTISDVFDPSAIVTTMDPGTNVLAWTIFNGPCPDAVTTDQMSISIFLNDLPVANAGPDQELCLPLSAANLTGSPLGGAATGLWTLVSGGGTIADPNNPLTQVANLPQGLSVFEWTVSNGPCGSTTDQVRISVFDPDAAVADAGADASYCTPISTHTLSANIPDIPGTGTWTLISGTGSVSNPNDPSANVSGLTIGENIFQWSIYNGPCDAPTTDLVSIFIYDENQAPAAAGPDQEICEPDASVIMSANSPVFPATGTWALVQGQGTIGDINDPNTIISGLGFGINIFEWTIDNGPCANAITSDQVAILRYEANPAPPDAGPDQQICTPTTSAVMAGADPTIPGVGTWTVVSGTGVFADVNDPNTVVTGLTVGENVFRWTVYNGPCVITNLSDLVSIFLFDNSQNTANAGPDQAFCTPVNATQLAGNSPIFPAYGEWTITSGSVTISDIFDPNALITNMAPGVNVLAWTIYNGPCPGAVTTDQMSISIFLDGLPAANAGPDQQLCLPVNLTTLTGSILDGAATGLWTVVSGGGTIANPTSSTTQVTNLPQGENVFAWTVNNGPCGTTTDQVMVSVYNPLADVADAGPPASYCTPVSTHTMAANVPQYPAVGTWSLVTGTGIISDPNDPSVQISGLTVGENIFLWSIYNGPCAAPTIDVVSIFIYNENTPDADAGPDQEICLPIDFVQMSASAAEFPAIGTWTLVQGTGVITDVNNPLTTVTGLAVGTNIFQWTVDNGPCENGITTDVVEIRVFDPNLPAPLAGPDQDICTPQSDVVMNASVPADPNYGFWTLSSGSGVVLSEQSPTSQIVGLAVGVNCFQWNIYNGTCASNILSDEVCINVFNQNQPAALAGPDQELCFPAVTTVMAANTPIIPAMGTWGVFAGDGDILNANDPTTTIANIPIGTNTFVWSVDNGPCQSSATSDQVNVLIFDPNAAPANAGEDVEICTPQDCVVLSATPASDPQTGTWTIISAVNENGPVAFGTINSVNNPSAEICALVVGVHTLQWELYNGPCENNTTDVVVISVFDDNAEPANAGADQELCGDGSETTMSANSPVFPGVGTWSVVSSPGSPAIADVNDAQTQVTGLDIGVTVLQWSIYNGPCAQPSTDLVTITVYDPESPDALAGPDQYFCEDFPTAVMAGNSPIFPAVGTWTIISGGGEIADINDPLTAINNIPLNQHIYVWTIYNGACANNLTSDTMSVYVNDLTVAAANAGEDQFFCGPPGTIQLQGSVTVGLATSEWTIVQGGGTISNIANNNPFLSDLPLGVNIYEYTVDNGVCGITTDQVVMTVYDPDLPVADAGPGATICEHEFTSFGLLASEPVPPAIGFWTILDGPIELNDLNDPNAIVLTLGEIATQLTNVSSVLAWTIDNGVCGTTTDTIGFILKDCLTIKIPDAFSPNGDGVNDEWIIPNIDTYPRNTVKIFNRWGAEIYSASPYTNMNAWDGRSAHPASLGEHVPVSTYYYILDLGTGEEAFHGFVYLKR